MTVSFRSSVKMKGLVLVALSAFIAVTYCKGNYLFLLKFKSKYFYMLSANAITEKKSNFYSGLLFIFG